MRLHILLDLISHEFIWIICIIGLKNAINNESKLSIINNRRRLTMTKKIHLPHLLWVGRRRKRSTNVFIRLTQLFFLDLRRERDVDKFSSLPIAPHTPQLSLKFICFIKLCMYIVYIHCPWCIKTLTVLCTLTFSGQAEEESAVQMYLYV